MTSEKSTISEHFHPEPTKIENGPALKSKLMWKTKNMKQMNLKSRDYQSKYVDTRPFPILCWLKVCHTLV